MPGLFDYDLRLKVDDIEKTIHLALADKFPFIAAIGSAKGATNKLYQWNAIRNDAGAITAVKDGVRVTDNDLTFAQPLTMAGYAQEIREAWGIGRQAGANTTHTSHNTPAWQKKAALERLTRKQSKLLLSAQEQVVGTANAAYKTRGIFSVLDPVSGSIQTGLAPQKYDPSLRVRDAAYFGGVITDLTAAKFEEMLDAAAEYLGDSLNLVGFCGLSLHKRMSQWTNYDQKASGQYTVSTRKSGEKIDVDLAVDVFKFNSGTVRVVNEYNLLCDLTTGKTTAASTNAGVFIDPQDFLVRQFQPLTHTDLKDEGQGKSGFYSWDGGLEARLPSKSLVVRATATASADSGSDSSSDSGEDTGA